MGIIRYRQARKANKIAAHTARHTARLAAAAERVEATPSPASDLSPEAIVRRQVARKSAKRIDSELKAGGYTDKVERRYIQTQVVRLVGEGSTVDEAIASVLRWRDEAAGIAIRV